MAEEDAYIVIERPVGLPVYIDGAYVGTIGVAVTESGTLKVSSVPDGAKIYLNKGLGDVYHGLTPQTLTLPAGPVPYILKVIKDGYIPAFDLIYILPGVTLTRNYQLDLLVSAEPEIAVTATLTVRCIPPAELWMYREGAEGFVSYGTCPQTVTLPATVGQWVPMEEAKKARAEGRMAVEEIGRLDTEDQRRQQMVAEAKQAYDDAKAARVAAEITLSEFRATYNLFLKAYNDFFKAYTSFMTMYNAASDKERAALEGQKGNWDTQKAQWDADHQYWTDLLKYYEERVAQYRIFEQQMKDEYDQAVSRAKAPFWLVTPGMYGATYRLKLTLQDYMDVVDRFTLMPGATVSKEYALVKALDLTTPESLAPFIINTPPPTPPEMPFAHAWLFIICWDQGVTVSAVWMRGAQPPLNKTGAFLEWHKQHYNELGPMICGKPGSAPKVECKEQFLKVPDGKTDFYISIVKSGGGYWANRQMIVKKTLNLAPGETRYIDAEYTAEGATTSPGLCPF